MMLNEFVKKHRHEPTEPQLAAMVDVFSILIIFLIAGTALDSSILRVPPEMKIPETISAGTTINAPQITVQNGSVYFSLTDKTYPVERLESEPEIASAIAKYQSERSSRSNKVGSSGDAQDYLNLIADKTQTYDKIFSAIQFFRAKGFKNIILVGTPRGK